MELVALVKETAGVLSTMAGASSNAAAVTAQGETVQLKALKRFNQYLADNPDKIQQSVRTCARVVLATNAGMANAFQYTPDDELEGLLLLWSKTQA